MIISGSRFPIPKGGAYRDDNAIEGKDRVNYNLGAGFFMGPNQTSP